APVTPEPAPLTREDGRRNVALLPGTTATVSSLIESETPFHKVEHLADGWYNNIASWISAGDPSWVEVDLGESHTINEIALGSEHTPTHNDRAITIFKVMVSESEKGADTEWKEAFSYNGEPIHKTRTF